MTALGAAEARRRFAASPVARLATVSGDGVPHLVPVTFAPVPDGDRLYFAVDHKPKRSTDLRRLRNIRENGRVCLLVDHYADDWQALWWARADGTAEIVEDAAGRAGPVGLLRAKYPQYDDRPPEGPVVTVTVTRWSGWSFS
jgi:PPOX class probable F420-dependent enzyme